MTELNFANKEALTPHEIVAALDKYIVGQQKAKRAVALALRNRWRRMQLDNEFRQEISPKNILMIGPTGVGKTEIARRLAKLAQAPFIKVEATKFTEVGYVGRDVESIVRDLMDVSIKLTRESALKTVMHRAIEIAEEQILDLLIEEKVKAKKAAAAKKAPKKPLNLPDPETPMVEDETIDIQGISGPKRVNDATRKALREDLRAGKLDDQDIDIELSVTPIGVEIMAPPGMEEMTNQLQHMFQHLSTEHTKVYTLTVKEALKQLKEDEAAKLLNEEDIQAQAVENMEQNGIVFIDEIDKIAKRAEYGSGADISREGVQRDLLPLVEGCTVSTKYGMVKTDHILFIASGAFHLSKPSDLVPELQGRLPIRVELEALTADDFARILVEPSAALTKQYQSLLGTESLNISFTEDGVRRIAEIAYQVNERTENIGARRLHTIMERLLENLSFNASELDPDAEPHVIDAPYVNEQLKTLLVDDDLSRYIL